jgi:hypothetical protein
MVQVSNSPHFKAGGSPGPGLNTNASRSANLPELALTPATGVIFFLLVVSSGI